MAQQNTKQHTHLPLTGLGNMAEATRSLGLAMAKRARVAQNNPTGDLQNDADATRAPGTLAAWREKEAIRTEAFVRRVEAGVGLPPKSPTPRITRAGLLKKANNEASGLRFTQWKSAWDNPRVVRKQLAASPRHTDPIWYRLAPRAYVRGVLARENNTAANCCCLPVESGLCFVF